jgi:hypothetical protein
MPEKKSSPKATKFGSKEWHQEVANLLLKLARGIRKEELSMPEILANLQVCVNALSERLDMVALEDKEALETIVFRTPKVVPNDPSYR